jgi:hypothetical protein
VEVRVTAEALVSDLDASVPPLLTALDVIDPSQSTTITSVEVIGTGAKVLAPPLAKTTQYQDVCQVETLFGQPVPWQEGYVNPQGFTEVEAEVHQTETVVDLKATVGYATGMGGNAIIHTKRWHEAVYGAASEIYAAATTSWPGTDVVIGDPLVIPITAAHDLWQIPQWYIDLKRGRDVYARIASGTNQGETRRIVPIDGVDANYAPANPAANLPWPFDASASASTPLFVAQIKQDSEGWAHFNVTNLKISGLCAVARWAVHPDDLPFPTSADPLELEIFADVAPRYLLPPGATVQSIGTENGSMWAASRVEEYQGQTTLSFHPAAISEFGGVPVGVYVPLALGYTNRTLADTASTAQYQSLDLTTYSEITLQQNGSGDWNYDPVRGTFSYGYSGSQSFRAILGSAGASAANSPIKFDWPAILAGGKPIKAHGVFAFEASQAYAFPGEGVNIQFGVELGADARTEIVTNYDSGLVGTLIAPKWLAWLKTNNGTTPGPWPVCNPRLGTTYPWPTLPIEIPSDLRGGITGFVMRITPFLLNTEAPLDTLRIYEAGVYVCLEVLDAAKAIPVTLSGSGAGGYTDFAALLARVIDLAYGAGSNAAAYRAAAPTMANQVAAALYKQERAADIIDRIGREANVIIRPSGVQDVTVSPWLDRVGTTSYDVEFDGMATGAALTGILEGSVSIDQQPITDLIATPLIQWAPDADGVWARTATVSNPGGASPTVLDWPNTAPGFGDFADAVDAWAAANEGWQTHRVRQQLALPYSYGVDPVRNLWLAPAGASGVSRARWAARRKSVLSMEVGETSATVGQRARVRHAYYTQGAWRYGTICEILRDPVECTHTVRLVLDIPATTPSRLIDSVDYLDRVLDAVDHPDSITDRI